MRSLLMLLVMSSVAAATPLSTSVTHMGHEPFIVIALHSAGKTAEQRYWNRAARFAETATLPSGTPLVLLARLAGANSGDEVAVIDAQRDGAKIRITLERRNGVCPASKNITWEPLVEIHLGVLDSGTYPYEIRERDMSFSCDPKLAKPVGEVLLATGALSVS